MTSRKDGVVEDLAAAVRRSGLPDEVMDVLISTLRQTRGLTRPVRHKIEKPWDKRTVEALIAFRKQLAGEHPNLTLLPFYVKQPKKSVWHCAWFIKRTGPGRRHPYAARSSLSHEQRSETAR